MNVWAGLSSSLDFYIVPESEKLGVVVSARVHPGETNASWMMKGMLDFLASGHHIAEVTYRAQWGPFFERILGPDSSFETVCEMLDAQSCPFHKFA